MHGARQSIAGERAAGNARGDLHGRLLACAVAVAHRAHGTAARLQGRGRRVPGCCPKLPERVS